MFVVEMCNAYLQEIEANASIIPDNHTFRYPIHSIDIVALLGKFCFHALYP